MERKVNLYLTEKGFLKIKLSKGGKVKITLEVKAKELHKYLKSIVPPIQPDHSIVDGYCMLYDNNKGKSAKKNIVDFVSNVYLNKNVKWVGRSTDEGYTIAIDNIMYHHEIIDPNDVEFFNDANLKGSEGPNSYVEARVKEDLRLINKEDIYRMYCSVYENGKHREKFHIDPKLQGNG